MPFTTLAERYEQRSKDIYGKFSPSADQFVAIKPDTTGVFGSRSRIKNDNRSVPSVSVLRDVRRVSKFLASPEGFLFTAKQTLLQTGNTFVNTKLYNPVSPLLNAVPFLHVRRNVPTNLIVPSPSGLLQRTTVNTVASRFETIGLSQAFASGERGLFRTVGNLARNYLVTQLKNAASVIVPLPQFYSSSRPEYKAFEKGGVRIFPAQPLSQRGTVRTNVVATITNVIASRVTSRIVSRVSTSLGRFIPKSLKNTLPTPTVGTLSALASNQLDQNNILSFVENASKFQKNFHDRNRNQQRLRSKYFNDTPQGAANPNVNPDPTENANAARPSGRFPDKKSIPSILNDPYNIAPFQSNTENFDAGGKLFDNKLNYANIITQASSENSDLIKSDIIKFIFKDADGGNPVHFRALLSTIKESIKPEFNEQRYVGRTERFVTYSGVKRSVNLTFNIVAFSPAEQDGMWTKVNYLSGLTFPKDVKNGFMVPPLFKITIGGIYDNQPCYIESLDYDFLDETITFDTDREVPFAINVTMQLSILEKRSKFHDSPFYKITEDAENVILDRAFNASISAGIGAIRANVSQNRIGRDVNPFSNITRMPPDTRYTSEFRYAPEVPIRTRASFNTPFIGPPAP
jgi:hypothetical protein